MTDPNRVPPRRGVRRASALVGLAAVLLLGPVLAGCSSDGGSSATTASTGAESAVTAAAVVVPASATVIDVRTPEEFAEGHLDGAVNLDVQSGRFEAELAALDPEGEYFVYCRSGNRSAAAAATMAEAGFTDVTDLGGLQDAADATGIEIVS